MYHIGAVVLGGLQKEQYSYLILCIVSLNEPDQIALMREIKQLDSIAEEDEEEESLIKPI